MLLAVATTLILEWCACYLVALSCVLDGSFVWPQENPSENLSYWSGVGSILVVTYLLESLYGVERVDDGRDGERRRKG